jgi:hypothetical protein
MKKKYTTKLPSKKLLKRYWLALESIENQFWGRLQGVEEVMEKETGIKGIEFIWCDNSIVGIGNSDRTMKLIQRYV